MVLYDEFMMATSEIIMSEHPAPKQSALDPLTNPSTAERVVNAIRNAILQGRLRPGDKVPEEDLARQLGISRTPVREAIRVLEQQGLVRVQPKKGTYIAKPNRTDETNALSVRVALEELAIKQAIERSTTEQWDALIDALGQIKLQMATAVDELDVIRAVELDIEFHTMLVGASNNPYLLRTWHLVGAPFLIWRPEMELYHPTEESLTTGITDRHEDLLDAIRTKNVVKCVEAIRLHISRKLAEIPVHSVDVQSVKS